VSKPSESIQTEQNKAIARILVENFNKGDLVIIDRIFAENFRENSAPPGISPDRDGLKGYYIQFRSAFPDAHYIIEDEIAEEDRVVHRLRCRGTMMGEFMGMPATGRSAEWEEIHIARFENGRIAEHWASVDQLGMLQQLGLAPK
jgi:steroid delta-isomerase-like uncharacterized protein